MKKTGGCLCGQVRYETKADPMMTGVCHCKNCQKQAGSAFSTLAAFQMADIEFSGDLALYEDSDTDTGNTVKRFFAVPVDRHCTHKSLHSPTWPT